MVVPSWAPQIQVLSHSSVGGFLTHCGWNSILESVLKGVPFITWPLFAEQKMNAVLLSEGLKVGVRPRVSENGLVERVEIVDVIKCLMEGEEGAKMRERMNELKEDATNASKKVDLLQRPFLSCHYIGKFWHEETSFIKCFGRIFAFLLFLVFLLL
uniref:UDP-glycosyltransferases domain-containing protein n=1 Tax=Glycine max TaxID=3847 RepID=C6T875_SOYBN|nr:unknown [Glycine max]